MGRVVADVGISAAEAVVMLFADVDIFSGSYCFFFCRLGYDSIHAIGICTCYHSSVRAERDVNYFVRVNVSAISRIQYTKFRTGTCCGKLKRSAVYREFRHICQSKTALNGYRNIPALDKHFITDDTVSIVLDGEPSRAAEGQLIRSCKYTLIRRHYLIIA